MHQRIEMELVYYYFLTVRIFYIVLGCHVVFHKSSVVMWNSGDVPSLWHTYLYELSQLQ